MQASAPAYICSQTESSKGEGNFEENYEEANTRILGAMWPDFVGNPEERWGVEKDILVPLAKNVRTKIADFCILDACAGIGLEAGELARLQLGRVFANEQDKYLRRRLHENLEDLDKENSEARNLVVSVSNMRWQEMADFIQHDRFGIILVLGNSLGYCGTAEDQIESLRSLLKIMHPEGRLVIDRRNYEVIMHSAQYALSKGQALGPDNHHSSWPMYNGPVKGVPIAVDPNGHWIRYEYTRTVQQADATRQGRNQSHEVGHLTMAPISHQQMLECLKEAGGKNIQVLSDFKPGHDPFSANFHQYVVGK